MKTPEQDELERMGRRLGKGVPWKARKEEELVQSTNGSRKVEWHEDAKLSTASDD